MEPDKASLERLEKDVDRLYEAFHILLWDYHVRHHLDEGDTTDYHSCVHYPCANFTIDIFPRRY